MPKPAVMALVGSKPIILSLYSDTAYIEQSAKAYDVIDGDISYGVTNDSAYTVDRYTAGSYNVTYTVVNSAGMETTIVREVRIVAPTYVILPRTTHSFKGSGKQGTTFTHKVTANDDGKMDITITPDKNMTATVKILDAAKKALYTDTVTATSKRQYDIVKGSYEITLTIDKANGNSDYALSVLMPEVEVMVEVDEVPLGYVIKGESAAGKTLTHSVVAQTSGTMDMEIVTLSDNMVITVMLIVEGDAAKRPLFRHTFDREDVSIQYEIEAGAYELVVTVEKAHGIGMYGITVEMPEVIENDDVPLGGLSIKDMQVPMGVFDFDDDDAGIDYAALNPQTGDGATAVCIPLAVGALCALAAALRKRGHTK